MKLKTSGNAEYDRWLRNIAKYAKQIELLKNKLALQGEVNIRNEFFKRFKSRTGETVKIRHEFFDDGITFISDTVYSQYLEDGVRSHVMRYLLKAKRPIPLKISKNKKENVYRVCTEKGIAQGKWRHKGIEKDRHVGDGLGFMQAGIDKTLLDANKEIENLKSKIRLG